MSVSACLLLICTLGQSPVLEVEAQEPVISVPERTDGAYDSEYFTNFQPRGSLSTPTSRSSDVALSTQRRTGTGGSYARLARVPNMFGDSIPPSFSAFICDCDNSPPAQIVTEFLTGGGARYTPISENNKPLPMDRVFFNYNGFNNAVTTTVLSSGTAFDSDLHRYTMGFEKTFFDGNSSFEMRLPLLSSLDIQTPDNSSTSGNVGNLTLVFKQLLFQTENTSMAAGMGLGLPTGDDLIGRSGDTDFTLANQATYLLPYLGMMHTINDQLFVTAFTQIDIAASGDDFQVEGRGSLGRINAPTFARFDLGGGYWLIRDADLAYLSGVALIAEFHYLTTLTDADEIIDNGATNDFALAGSDNRVDYLNLTAGVHWQITELTNLRFSGVVPLRLDPDRQFDSEVQVSFNRNF